MLKSIKMSSLLLVVFLLMTLLISSARVNAAETTFVPTEKTTGIVKNPGMGWVLYCDAFGQMTNASFPNYDKGVFYPDLFWQTFDNCGATAKANTFYLRAPWSFYEPSEGQYAWNDTSSNFHALVQGALDRGLRLAFRVYIDSQDSYQQATPQYVKNAGAKGYTNTFWTPYANDAVFLSKFKTFIAAFGAKYNDSSKVDFIDAMGLGAWGEGHNIRYDTTQTGPNLNYVLDNISSAYKAAFPGVLLGGQQGGSMASYAESAALSNKYDILRRDSIGMSQYFTSSDKAYYADMVARRGIPLFSENGWNYFAHDFAGYMSKNGNPFSNIRDMLVYCLNDAKEARANTFDLRVPEDAIEWMKNVDLVDDFIVNGGYRLVPVSFTFLDAINSNSYITIKNTWKNTGIGRMPNNRPEWNYKYKVAFALLDKVTEQPVYTSVTNIDPSDWLKGTNYEYDSYISFGNIPNGTYDFAYAIVDTTNGNKPDINLAITNAKASTGWYKIGSTTVAGIGSTAPLTKLPSYKLSENFSTTQGQNQWYYMQSNGTTYTNMTWNQANNNWKGDYTWNLISKLPSLHPDTNDTVIAWKAPSSGTVVLKGNPRKDNTGGGDGVNVKIVKNSSQLWPASGWQFIGATDKVGVIYNTTTYVYQNDIIYFIVNKNGNNSYDGTLWNPTIDYIPGTTTVNKANLATASATWGTSGGNISFINNNVLTDAWGSATGLTFPGYITLDFGSTSVSTSKLTLVTHYGQGQGITNVDVEYYNGTTWVTAVSNVGITWNLNTDTEEFKDIIFPAVTTTKIRLKVNNGNMQWNKIALNELQVLCAP